MFFYDRDLLECHITFILKEKKKKKKKKKVFYICQQYVHEEEAVLVCDLFSPVYLLVYLLYSCGYPKNLIAFWALFQRFGKVDMPVSNALQFY